MADKILGRDHTNETTPTSTMTVTLDNGTANVDVALADFHKGLTAASTTVASVVELATNAETVTGTDTVRATTPAGVAAAIAAGSSQSVLVQAVHTQSGAVQTGTTTIPLDDTIPQNTEGTEFYTLAITPTSATNKLLIEVRLNVSYSVIAFVTAALFQNTTAGALCAGYTPISASNYKGQVSLRHEMVAGTTSATTFKVRAGGHTAGTVTINGASGARELGGVLISSLRISEIKV